MARREDLPSLAGTPGGRPGVTLLETVMAMAILAVLVVGGLRLMGITGFGTARTGAQAQATRLLQSLAEECRGFPLAEFEKTYAALGPGGEAELDPRFYPVTLEKLKEWKANTTAPVRDFQASATVRIFRNSLGQITEIWYFPEVRWLERTGAANSEMKRQVRAGFMRSNPLAIKEGR